MFSAAAGASRETRARERLLRGSGAGADGDPSQQRQKMRDRMFFYSHHAPRPIVGAGLCTLLPAARGIKRISRLARQLITQE